MAADSPCALAARPDACLQLSSASAASGASSTRRADAPCTLPPRSVTRPRRGVLARRPLKPRVPVLVLVGSAPPSTLMSLASSASSALSTRRADSPCTLPTYSVTRSRRGVLAQRLLELCVPALVLARLCGPSAITEEQAPLSLLLSSKSVLSGVSLTRHIDAPLLTARALSAAFSGETRADASAHSAETAPPATLLSSASLASGASSARRANASCASSTRSVFCPRRGVLARRPLDPRSPLRLGAVLPPLQWGRLRPRSSLP